MRETVFIWVSVADVHGEPNAASERLTQALLGRPGLVLVRRPGWLRLAFDDYEGWVAEDLVVLAPPTGRALTPSPSPTERGDGSAPSPPAPRPPGGRGGTGDTPSPPAPRPLGGRGGTGTDAPSLPSS
ncbi:MAG: hypothetical protein HY331_05825, partial [Chloroflexi bacterium]|nr:hypothetical protein [Chloroflexota bacterium]